MEFEELWDACIETEEWMDEEDIPYFKKFVLFFYQIAIIRCLPYMRHLTNCLGDISGKHKCTCGLDKIRGKDARSR